MLLWQSSVATRPLIFVIATCIWSELIIYLLVSCNKQLVQSLTDRQHQLCPITYGSHLACDVSKDYVDITRSSREKSFCLLSSLVALSALWEWGRETMIARRQTKTKIACLQADRCSARNRSSMARPTLKQTMWYVDMSKNSSHDILFRSMSALSLLGLFG